MSEYPDFVPRNEWPDKTIASVPDTVIRDAMASLRYGACPECGTRQWMNYVTARESTHNCRECDTIIKTER